ncbi:MAG: magnesium chelatase subunit [Solirubrobacteraceae bacterium]|nr:magnesium chelatase subunit [Solirubrobacteraceae bacterium]
MSGQHPSPAPDSRVTGRRRPYPLSAIVGQDDLVEALLVCAVHPVVGGVLIRGERGTAKSTAVRALAPILGDASGSGSSPLVELPLGATLDRLVGTLDLRAALAGEHRVEEGMLGRADGGLLYVDEVNLLADHLVDALLDASAAGEVTIERDGVSLVAPARFLLVGTMNPEEGELRPQLLDRFGLGVEVSGPRDPATRARIVRRRMDFDAAPEAFAAAWEDAERAIVERIAAARPLVPGVRIPDRELLRISRVCAELDLDGIRGDLVCAHAACALAALDRVDEVAPRHVDRAAHLALRHRLRRDPLDPAPGPGDPAIEDALTQTADDPGAGSDGPAGEDARPAQTGASTAGRGTPAAPGDGRRAPTESQNRTLDPGAPQARPPFPTPRPQSLPDPDLAGPPLPPPCGPGPPAAVPPPLPSRLPEALLRVGRGGRGRGTSGRAPGGRTAVLDSRPALDGEAIAILPSLLAGIRGDRRPQTAILGGRRGAVLCLIVDTSGSMAAQRRLGRVKGALEVALRRAYARRDLVGIVAFGGDGARTLVEPGVPLERAAAAVRTLPAGGRTPLAAGIAHGARLIESVGSGRLAGFARVAVLLTDGRAADPGGRAVSALRRLVAAADRTVVVDLEDGRVRLGLAAGLAAAAGADLTRLVTDADRSAA